MFFSPFLFFQSPFTSRFILPRVIFSVKALEGKINEKTKSG